MCVCGLYSLDHTWIQGKCNRRIGFRGQEIQSGVLIRVSAFNCLKQINLLSNKFAVTFKLGPRLNNNLTLIIWHFKNRQHRFLSEPTLLPKELCTWLYLLFNYVNHEGWRESCTRGKEFQRDAVCEMKVLVRVFLLHLSKARVYRENKQKAWFHSQTIRSDTLVAHFFHSKSICKKDPGLLHTYGHVVGPPFTKKLCLLWFLLCENQSNCRRTYRLDLHPVHPDKGTQGRDLSWGHLCLVALI